MTMPKQPNEDEYVEVEGQIITEQDWAYEILFGEKRVWVAKSRLEDIDITLTIRCRMVREIAKNEGIIE